MRFPNLSFLTWNRSKVNATHSPDDHYENDDYDMDAYGYDGYEDEYEDEDVGMGVTEESGGNGKMQRAMRTARNLLPGQASARRAKEEQEKEKEEKAEWDKTLTPFMVSMDESRARLESLNAQRRTVMELAEKRRAQAERAFANSRRTLGSTQTSAYVNPHLRNRM